jgi:hypothetical protein
VDEGVVADMVRRPNGLRGAGPLDREVVLGEGGGEAVADPGAGAATRADRAPAERVSAEEVGEDEAASARSRAASSASGPRSTAVTATPRGASQVA